MTLPMKSTTNAAMPCIFYRNSHCYLLPKQGSSRQLTSSYVLQKETELVIIDSFHINSLGWTHSVKYN